MLISELVKPVVICILQNYLGCINLKNNTFSLSKLVLIYVLEGHWLKSWNSLLTPIRLPFIKFWGKKCILRFPWFFQINLVCKPH